jgi:hypothetical protein
MTDTMHHRIWQNAVKKDLQAHLNLLLAGRPCYHCLSGFWCPFHGENPELDDITEVEENTYLRKRVEELEVENERLKDLQVAAAFFVTCREKYQHSDISANLTDTYALGKLKQALRKSWGPTSG